MLTIRREQIEAFERAALKRFKRRVVDFLVLHAPLDGRGRDDVAARVEEGLQSARVRGVTSEIDVARYIYLSFLWGKGCRCRSAEGRCPSTMGRCRFRQTGNPSVVQVAVHPGVGST
jgi:hypothetical protein